MTQTGSPANGDFWKFSIVIPEKGVSKKERSEQVTLLKAPLIFGFILVLFGNVSQ